MEEVLQNKEEEEVIASKKKGPATLYSVCGAIMIIVFVFSLLLIPFMCETLPQFMGVLCVSLVCLANCVFCFIMLGQYNKTPDKIITYKNGQLYFSGTVRRPMEITNIYVKKQGGAGGFYKIKLFFGAMAYEVNFVAFGETVARRLYQLKYDDLQRSDLQA